LAQAWLKVARRVHFYIVRPTYQICKKCRENWSQWTLEVVLVKLLQLEAFRRWIRCSLLQCLIQWVIRCSEEALLSQQSNLKIHCPMKKLRLVLVRNLMLNSCQRSKLISKSVWKTMSSL
jgi:hypothetical protein